MTVTSPRPAGGGSEQRDDRRRPARGPAARAVGPVRTRLRAGVRYASDWLDRPMASLHLIQAIFALLLGFGLLMVLSSSSVTAFRTGGSSFGVFANQATFALVGLVLFGATQYLPVRLMRSLSTAAVMFSILLLVAVLIPGVGKLVNGARSWIAIGGFQFQPSEVAKLALLLWMGHVLAARRSTLASPRSLLIPVLPVFILIAGLIMMQPDLGTTTALLIVFMACLFFAGAPWWMFASLAGLAVLGVTALALSATYRLARVLSFLNPDPRSASGWQLAQSLYGMGNGGVFGVGLGQSRAKWSYLPNADSDFIFAIVGEELGFIGAALLLLLFGLLAYTGLRIARRNVDPFVKIVASAGTVWLVGQAGINICYVVGLLPVTGIPLPMISAGGTSLIITMVVFGLLANFARSEPEAAAVLQANGGNRLARFLGVNPKPGAGAKRAAKRTAKAERRAAKSAKRAAAAKPAPVRKPAGPTRRTPDAVRAEPRSRGAAPRPTTGTPRPGAIPRQPDGRRGAAGARPARSTPSAYPRRNPSSGGSPQW